MRKLLERLKEGGLPKLFKALGIIVVLLILFEIYSSVVLDKNSVDLGVKKVKQNIALNSVREMSAPTELAMSESFASDEVDSAGFVADKEPLGSSGSIQNSVPEKRVIKNGFLTLKVEQTNSAVEKITEIVSVNKGEIFSSNFNEYRRGSKTGTISVKIPVDNFQKTIVELKTVATQVVSESTSGRDVTERYVDLQAQLKNKKAEEQTFVSLLDRSGKLDDVLSVSREIARVRGDIERLEGKIKYLESQTDMSTITINISEDIEITPISDDWRPVQVMKKAFNDLKKQSQDTVDAIIHFIIVTIPSFIPFILFVTIVYWIGRKLYQIFLRK
ncbi:DUF4349 domain-containing protein [bacterium]|jgi:hypothetical protein|nr:DUF4349 domain-containing protein [bacterium]MBT4250775.1 DUF4349 domain-containing protein [bacterium]MBT4598219.1 DUF4349 domain-containing protein [bacterium]MBT6753817.1 DUF4349 domain-containing protein [bacterium]MBT7037470.1 DUF4349 domain-containing protein [bacterium]